jgi:hypothetical protein
MKVTNKGGDFPKCPEGLHQSVCVDVIDRGLVDYSYQGQPKGKRREVSFVYQVDVRDEDTGEEIRRNDGKRFTVSTKFTASLSQNARLVPFLEQWLGKTIPPEVRESGFDLEDLVGRNAQITVIHDQKGDKTYANIKGILPVSKKMGKLVPEDYIRVKDRPDYDPPFGSEEWERRHREADEDEVPVSPPGYDEEEDDLPF